MEYPTLNVKQKSRQMSDAFLGYNHNLRIGDSEFYDMKNMTSDHYPVLAPRGSRGIYKDGIRANCMIAKDTLCYVDGSVFVIGEDRIEMNLIDGLKNLISMGSYVIIMPDKKWINTVKQDGKYEYGDIELENEINPGGAEQVDIRIGLCKQTGEPYGGIHREEPNLEDGNIWYDTDSVPPVLKKYSAAQKMWVSIPTTYVKISAAGIGANLNQYDGIEISGIVNKDWSHLNGYHAVWSCDDDDIIITGTPTSKLDLEGLEVFYDNIKVSRKMPVLDFIIESNNRLWGCRYGTDVKGNVVNEIYASKLGDFKNWNCLMSLSTDSYTASCGTDGPFTGAITYMGYPLFFKENCVHKVYGNYPANFQIQTTACRGVQNGSHNSLAIVNETLFYKSSNAVCAYDGSLPVEMSTALGDVRYSDAVACAYGNKYYIDMKDSDDTYHLFVYDMAKGMWHKEDNLRVDWFCSFGGEIYAIEHGKDRIITIFGTGTKDVEKVPWMVESGLVGMSMPDMKYISRLLIRMALEVGATVEISIQYDSMGDWEQVCQMTVTSLRSFAVPIRPRRCDHFRIRIEGVGQGKIYSITKTIEQGSDVS